MSDRSKKNASIGYPFLSLSIAYSLMNQESKIKPSRSFFQSA